MIFYLGPPVFDVKSKGPGNPQKRRVEWALSAALDESSARLDIGGSIPVNGTKSKSSGSGIELRQMQGPNRLEGSLGLLVDSGQAADMFWRLNDAACALGACCRACPRSPFGLVNRHG
jgi:hypothetical protein